MIFAGIVMPTLMSLPSLVLGSASSTGRTARSADAVASWLLAFSAALPWLVLAKWGVQLSYSVAGGMLPLAMWWASRLCLAPWPHLLSGRRCSLLGAALAGAGMWALAAHPHMPAQPLAWLALVTGWVMFSESLRGLGSATPHGGGLMHGLGPALAAALWLLAGDPLAWQSHWQWHILALLCLGVGAFVLWPQVAVADNPAHADAPRHSNLPDVATLVSRSVMGLMMGGLFVFDQSCLGAAWPPVAVVGLHLGVMAVLSGMAQALRASSLHSEFLGCLLLAWRLPLLLVGNVMVLASSGPPWTILGMALQVLAWVIDTHWRRAPVMPPSRRWRSVLPISVFVGPALLLLVGTYAAVQGPSLLAGLQLGLVLLGVLAQGWRAVRPG
ncbi:MAG: hypothetical protein RLZZ591_2051 [Pseudomonadota bacterium]